MKNNTILRGLGCATMLFLAFAPFANAQTSGAEQERMEMTTQGSVSAGGSGGSDGSSIVPKTEVGAVGGIKAVPIMYVDTGVQATTAAKIVPVTSPAGQPTKGGNATEMNVDAKGNILGKDGMLEVRGEMMVDVENSGSLFDNEIDLNVEALMEGEDGEGHHAAGTAEVDSATKVKSATDFEHYVAFKATEDARLEAVRIKKGKLMVTYAMPVKFFGIWRTSMNTTAEVNSTGAVEVKYPWYSVFMGKEFSKNTLEAAFSASLEAHQHANANSAVQATTTETVSAKSYVVPHVFDTVVKTFSEASSAELSYTAKAGKTGKTK